MTRRGSWARPLLAAGFGWLALALLASGCGPRYGNITGKVTYKGNPIVGGTITFYDSVNQARSSDIKSDGTYTVNRVASGHARVTVAAPMDISLLGPGGKKTAIGSGEAKPMQLPVNLGDPEKSGLTYDVIAGDQKKDFALD